MAESFSGKIHGKEIVNREGEPGTEVFIARLYALQALRQAAGLLAQVPTLSHLLPRARAARADSRRRQIKLVRQPSAVSFQP
jgi:hypothetical protein